MAANGIATALLVGTTPIIASSGGLSATTNLTVTPAILVQLAISPINPILPIGSTQALTVTARYSDGSTIDVSNSSVFTAATPAVAKITENSGIVTAVTTGTSVLTAVFNGMTVSTTVTVAPAQLVSIAVTPGNANVFITGTQSFIATGTYTDGSSADITNTVAWVSSDVNKATILPTGVATGLAVGSIVMTATLNSKSGSGTLIVSLPISLVSIDVTPNTAAIFVANTRAFIATALYSDNSTANISNLVSWTSSNTTIATILPTGIATAFNAGTTNIIASYQNKSDSSPLTVSVVPTLVSIAVTPLNTSAAIGARQQFTAIGTYSNLSTANISNVVVWSSSNAVIATISNSAPKGRASALSAGVVAITATQGSISGNTSFTVTPLAIVGIDLGVADSFAVLAGASITNNSGGLTLITGDVGSPSQTVDPVQVADYTNYKSGAILTNALADLQIAISDANSRACTVNSASGIDLGGLTLPPGVYCYAGAINITGTFAMNGPGLYIFRTSSTLDSASNSIVALNGGASAGNVFWVPTAASTLGANSAFQGTIMANAAAITMGDLATLENGRVLSASAVTLKNNVISR